MDLIMELYVEQHMNLSTSYQNKTFLESMSLYAQGLLMGASFLAN
jgi:hypothetical protein